MSCPQRSRPAAGWRVEARGRDRSLRAARGVRQAGAESVVRPPVHGAWKRGRWRRGRCGRVPGLACGVGLPARGVAGYGGVRRCDGPGGCAAVHESAPRPASHPYPSRPSRRPAPGLLALARVPDPRHSPPCRPLVSSPSPAVLPFRVPGRGRGRSSAPGLRPCPPASFPVLPVLALPGSCSRGPCCACLLPVACPV